MTFPGKIIVPKIMPPICDVVAVLVYLWALPTLAVVFQNKSVENGLLIGLVYILFCGSVYLIGKLHTESENENISNARGLLAFTGITFGIFVAFMMADAAGFFEKLDTLEVDLNNTVTSLVVLAGVFGWFIISFLYVGVLLWRIQPSISQQTRIGQGLQLVSLLGVNLMIVVTVIYWDCLFADTQPYDSIETGGKILIFVLTYVVFLIFFASPRLLLLSKSPGVASVITFLLQTGYYVWNTLSRVAW